MAAARLPAPVQEVPPERPSGVALRSTTVLVVGLDDETSLALRLEAKEQGVGFVRVAQGIAAWRKIRECRPTVIAIGASLWRDEVIAIRAAAAEVGAYVIEVPAAPRAHLARALVRAAVSER